jgi:DNA-directed RNA polymerase subunit F
LPESVLRAVEDRIGLYDTGRETDSEHAEQLRRWGKDHLRPLVDRLSKDGRLRVVSWEDCIDAIADAEPAAGREIEIFYRRCRDFEPERGNPNEVTT